MSIRPTYQILGCVKLSELNALSDINKELFKLIISATNVDMDDDAWIREKLWDMFPLGTETGDALRNPVNGLLEPEIPEPEE